MWKVFLFSILLLLGLFGSPWFPDAVGPGCAIVGDVIRVLTMVGLAFIMIRVGYEFDIDQSNLRRYGWDSVVAVAIGMRPRGEVGAGVLIISMSYGIGGAVVTVAMLSLALNLLLTGVFIYLVKRLTQPLPAYAGLVRGTAAQSA